MVQRIDVDIAFHNLCRNGFMMCVFGILFIGTYVTQVSGFTWLITLVLFMLYILQFILNISNLRKVTEEYVNSLK